MSNLTISQLETLSQFNEWWETTGEIQQLQQQLTNLGNDKRIQKRPSKRKRNPSPPGLKLQIESDFKKMHIK